MRDFGLQFTDYDERYTLQMGARMSVMAWCYELCSRRIVGSARTVHMHPAVAIAVAVLLRMPDAARSPVDDQRSSSSTSAMDSWTMRSGESSRSPTVHAVPRRIQLWTPDSALTQ